MADDETYFETVFRGEECSGNSFPLIQFLLSSPGTTSKDSDEWMQTVANEDEEHSDLYNDEEMPEYSLRTGNKEFESDEEEIDNSVPLSTNENFGDSSSRALNEDVEVESADTHQLKANKNYQEFEVKEQSSTAHCNREEDSANKADKNIATKDTSGNAINDSFVMNGLVPTQFLNSLDNQELCEDTSSSDNEGILDISLRDNEVVLDTSSRDNELVLDISSRDSEVVLDISSRDSEVVLDTSSRNNEVVLDKSSRDSEGEVLDTGSCGGMEKLIIDSSSESINENAVEDVESNQFISNFDCQVGLNVVRDEQSWTKLRQKLDNALNKIFEDVNIIAKHDIILCEKDLDSQILSLKQQALTTERDSSQPRAKSEIREGLKSTPAIPWVRKSNRNILPRRNMNEFLCSSSLNFRQKLPEKKNSKDSSFKVYRNANELKEEDSKHFISESNVSVSNFKCSKCEFTSNFYKFVKRHELLAHVKCLSDNDFKKLPSDHQIYKCSFCKFVTNFKKNLRHHELKHYNKKKFKCSLCPFETNYHCSLNRHHLSHFPGPKSFNNDMSMNLNEILPQQTKTVAPADDALALRKINEANDNGDSKPALFHCSKCQFSTIFLRGLGRHTTVVHPNTIKTESNVSNHSNKVQEKKSCLKSSTNLEGNKKLVGSKIKVNNVNKELKSKVYEKGMKSKVSLKNRKFSRFKSNVVVKQEILKVVNSSDKNKLLKLATAKSKKMDGSTTVKSTSGDNANSKTRLDFKNQSGSKPNIIEGKQEEFQIDDMISKKKGKETAILPPSTSSKVKKAPTDHLLNIKLENHKNQRTPTGSKGIFKCPICSFTAKYKKVLKKHEMKHPLRSLGLDEINTSKSRRTDREEGIPIKSEENRKTEEGKRFQCLSCEYSSKFKSNVKQHTARVHKVDDTQSVNKGPAAASNLNQHKRQTVGTPILKSLSEKDQRILEESKLFKCSTCSYTSNFKGGVYKHEMTTHSRHKQIADSKTKNLKEVSPKIFNGSSRTTTTSTPPQSRRREFFSSLTKPKAGFKCDECDYVTNFIGNLQAHELKHSKTKNQNVKFSRLGIAASPEGSSRLIKQQQHLPSSLSFNHCESSSNIEKLKKLGRKTR